MIHNNASIVVDTFYCDQLKRAIVFRVWLPIYKDGEPIPLQDVALTGLSCEEIVLN